MTTEYYCTRCGKEFEPGETAYALDLGTVEKDLPLWDAEFSSSQGAWEEVMCDECHTKLFAPEPNRVVVELTRGLFVDSTIAEVRAECPGETCVIVLDYVGAVGYGIGGSRPIKQLNTMKEEA